MYLRGWCTRLFLLYCYLRRKDWKYDFWRRQQNITCLLLWKCTQTHAFYIDECSCGERFYFPRLRARSQLWANLNFSLRVTCGGGGGVFRANPVCNIVSDVQQQHANLHGAHTKCVYICESTRVPSIHIFTITSICEFFFLFDLILFNVMLYILYLHVSNAPYKKKNKYVSGFLFCTCNIMCWAMWVCYNFIWYVNAIRIKYNI